MPSFELDELQLRLATELLVPAGRTVDHSELGSFVLATYYEAASKGPEGLTRELVAETYRFLPLSQTEIVDTANGFEQGDIAADSLAQVDQETETQIDDAYDKVSKLDIERPLLAVADQLSEDAHVGTFRKNNLEDDRKQPYRMHVIRVAAMGLHIARAVEAELGLEHDRDFTEAGIILDLHHDAVENTSPIGKHYDPEREGHFSPLLIHSLMERFGHPYSRDVAEGLMVITHFKKMSWMRGYDDYIRERVMSSLLATLTKQRDIFDNRHNDPKTVRTEEEARRRDKKHSEYDETIPKLQNRAIELAPPDKVERVKQANATLLGIEPGMQKENVDNLRDYIGNLALAA